MKKKELLEKIANCQEKMDAIVAAAKAENRTLTEDEVKQFNEIEAEAKTCQETVDAIEKVEAMKKPAIVNPDDNLTQEQKDIKAFEQLIRSGDIQQVTDMEKGDNGAVIPTSIANKIIDKVVEICPIFQDADRYNVKGTLTIPYWDETTDHITVDYATEFTAADSHTGKFLNISLTGFLATALVDISKSLINNSSFDVVGFVINKMGQAIAAWIEGQLLYGESGGMDGLAAGITQNDKTASNSAVTIDEIIALQEMIPDVYQRDAYFIMNKKTRTLIRSLKDGDGNYLLNRDLNSRWGYTLLGKDVYCSDNVLELKAANAGKYFMFYGDMKGLAVKVSEDINIEVLKEVKAAQHVVEVVGFVELDAKVQNAQMVAGLKVKS